MALKQKIQLILFVVAALVSTTLNAQDAGEQSLDAKQQAIVRISALTGRGDLAKLKTELVNGLETGLKVNEIKEVIVHLYAYCGFPRSIRGLQTLMEVLEERKANGIEDDLGPEANNIADVRDKYQRGVETLFELTGKEWAHPKSGYGAFSPAIDTFLKEHLFADLFERDILNYAQRELVTISVLSSLGGVEPMLRSHLAICLRLGLSRQQLQQFVSIIQSTLGRAEGESAQTALEEVLKAND